MAIEPVTREERFFAAAGGRSVTPPTPITRKEQLLQGIIDAVKSGGATPDVIKGAVNDYLNANPVQSGATTEQAAQIEKNKNDIADLQIDVDELKESGGNGSGQNPPQDGEDGFSPIAIVTQTATGATISITDKNGTTTATVTNGKDGDDGYTPKKGVDYFDGSPGKDGYTPVRGTDYWTEADKVEIVQRVIESLGGNPIFGIVDENNNIIVSGNLSDGTYSVKYEMEDGTTVSIGNLVLDSNVYYSITKNLTNCTISNSATQVIDGESYSATITAKSGYVLKSVVVTMGGSPVTVSGGSINIASVSGNIVITAVAEEKVVTPSYTNLADPTSADWAVGKRFDGSGGLKDVDAGVNGATTNYIGGGVGGFAVGDVIRVKGMDLTTYRTIVYNNSKVAQSIATLSGQTAYFSDITVNSTGASFKIKSSNMPSDGYIRFCGPLTGTSADVIITKNEEIA